MAALFLGSANAPAGPGEDGMVAYNRSDYVPAIRLFRLLTEAGRRRKGRGGVTFSPTRAFMWFSVAAKRGDAGARAGLRDVSRKMTPAEMSQAQQMAQVCEASNYRSCEY